MLRMLEKRDGSLVAFDPDKLNKWAEWANEKAGVDWSEIALEAVSKVTDGCKATELHQAMIMACLDKDTEAHLKMAGRLLLGELYKQAFGGHDIPHLKDFAKKMEAYGWDCHLAYSEDELDKLNAVLRHDLDKTYSYPEIKQHMDKYAISDRITNVVLESPQFTYMRMAMGNMALEDKEKRLEHVINLYNLFANKILNSPTPNRINLGTTRKGLASCCVYKTNDTKESLSTGQHIAELMTCASAGIGAYLETRSLGDGIDNNRIKHLGKIPLYRAVDAAVHEYMQHSRGGAATITFNCFDPELDPDTTNLLAIRNPKTADEKRVDGIDFSFGYCTLLAKYAAQNLKWPLVSYAQNPMLHNALYSGDDELLEPLVLQAIKDAEEGKQGKLVKARDLVLNMLINASETGRVYETNLSEMNSHTPFTDPIYSSNLCQEIALPTEGYSGVTELYSEGRASGEIGLCNLVAICLGRFKDTDENWKYITEYAVRYVDNCITMMEYPFPHLKATAQYRRSLGIGLTNLAYEIARRGLKYSDEAGRNFIHRIAEKHSYWLHRASLALGKEKGVAAGMERSLYKAGWTPVQTYNKAVDGVHSQKLMYDWEALSREIAAAGGIRNSVLEAFMPVESSSLESNTCNGIYPIRRRSILKGNATNKVKWIAPEYDELSYELAWNIPTERMIEVYAIFQKFCGQAISADLYHVYSEDKPQVSAKELLKQWLYRVKLGLKTRYYINSSTAIELDRSYEEVAEKCGSGGCVV